VSTLLTPTHIYLPDLKDITSVIVLMVKLKNEKGSCNVRIWEWLLKLIEYLGADGMSSEVSGVEINDEGIV
jgi:hypothetical protein